LFGIATELRPTFAVGDPAALFVDRSHVSCNQAAAVAKYSLDHFAGRPVWPPVTTDRKGVEWTLAIRFQNVATAKS
jgi:hypothetical protein